MMSKAEWDRMKQDVGERKGVSLTCPYLNKWGLCDAYAVRPAICRLWGVVKKMACPWGCQPERWLTDAETYAILQRLDSLG